MTLTKLKILSISAVLLCSFCPSNQIFAQDTKYDLYELIELGLQQAIPYQTEMLQNKNIHSLLLSTYLDFLPSASVSASRSLIDDQPKNAGFYLSKSISLNEPTYFNWRRANIDWQNARLDIEEQRKTTVFEIFRRYIRVLETGKRVEIQNSNLEIQEKIFEQVELLFNQQQRALIDLKQSEIALINAQISLENADIQYRQARENLFLYLNVEDLGYDLKEPMLSIVEDEYEYKPPVSLIQAENNLKKSSISLWQTRLDFLPSLSVSYSYNYSYPGLPYSDDLFAFDKYRDSYTLFLNASYSLFNQLQHRQVYYRNQRNLRVQQMQYDFLANDKERQFEQLKREWENENKIYGLSERRYELALDNLDMAQEMFNLGIMSLLELDQVTSDYLEAEIDLSSRYYQLLIKQEEINLFLSRRILDRW